jgi:hypothetical protein
MGVSPRKIGWALEIGAAIAAAYKGVEWAIEKLGDADFVWNQLMTPDSHLHTVLGWLSRVPGWVPAVALIISTLVLILTRNRASSASIELPEKPQLRGAGEAPIAAPQLSSLLQLKFIESSKKYVRPESDGWTTYQIGLHNKSETETVKGVCVRMPRFNPVPTGFHGKQNYPMKFRDLPASQLETDIRPGETIYVDIISFDERPDEFTFGTFRIANAPDGPTYMMKGKSPVDWNDTGETVWSGDNNPANDALFYDFDLSVTADGVPGRITETFEIGIDRQADTIELRRRRREY